MPTKHSPGPRAVPDKAVKLLEKAAGHQHAGRPDLAIKAYRDYLRQLPWDAASWHQLGGLEFQLGRTKEAIRALKRAVDLRPDVPDLQNDLAGLLFADGQFEAAERGYRAVIAAFPQFTPALYNLADLLFRRDRIEESINCLTEVVKRCPDWAQAHFNLAVAHERAAQIALALESMKRAHRLNPHLPKIAAKLGGLCRALHYQLEAIEHYNNALNADPADIDAVLGLAQVQAAEGRGDEALALLTDFLDRHPGDPRLPLALADLWMARGDNQEAERCYNAALLLDPGNADAIYGKSWVRKYNIVDTDWISHLERLATNEAVNDATRSTAQFALGKVYNDCNQFELAFVNARKANETCKQMYAHRRYERSAHEDHVSALIETCSLDWIRQWTAEDGVDSELPVLVIGMPRSGTTLAEQIISSHPLAHGAGELVYFTSLADLLPAQIPGGGPYPTCLKQLNSNLAKRIATGYLELLKRHSASALRIVDKNPFNFLHLGLIGSLFPKARIIMCRRDPLDVAVSIYFQSFSTYSNFAWDLLDIGHYYLQYLRLMAHWNEVWPGRILEFDYEQVIEDQETASRKLIGACDLEWDDACLRFHETPREVKTASVWQVRQPIYRTSKSRWLNYARHLAPLRELLATAPL